MFVNSILFRCNVEPSAFVWRSVEPTSPGNACPANGPCPYHFVAIQLANEGHCSRVTVSSGAAPFTVTFMLGADARPKHDSYANVSPFAPIDCCFNAADINPSDKRTRPCSSSTLPVPAGNIFEKDNKPTPICAFTISYVWSGRD
jgi:hypothetical protein